MAVSTERKKHTRAKKNGGQASFGVLIVQCVACAAMVLLLWMFSYFGGDAFRQLKQILSEQMNDHSLMTAITVWLDDHRTEESEDEPSQTPDSKENAVLVSASPISARPDAVCLPIDPECGTVTSLFGGRNNPTASGTEFHKGLDIAAEQGTPIAAMMFGVVTDQGQDRWLGNYVVIAHGDWQVTYAHCDRVSVKTGAVVKAGEPVATVGSTGNSTGNHLHIELRKGGDVCDPSVLVPVSRYD